MLRRFLHGRLAAFEREYDCDMGYAHAIADASLPAFRHFLRFRGMAAHRESVPVTAWYAARLAAVLGEDCGPCTQLIVTAAEREGLDPALLRALLESRDADLDVDTRLGWTFARAVLARDPQAEAAREAVRVRWGERGLVSLAYALAATRVFPTLKYALGHGQACVRVRVGGADVRPAPLGA